MRAYLPPIAAHNLLMGAELLLTQAGTSRRLPGRQPRRPKSIDERLAAVTTLVFPKESLQRALELLADDIGVAIDIDGAAFRTAGVTQNQTLALDLRDRPAGEILVEILRRANPDRTATGAADPRQTLVYVDRAGGRGRGAGAAGRIIVTTRAAAAARGLPLPAPFVGAAE